MLTRLPAFLILAVLLSACGGAATNTPGPAPVATAEAAADAVRANVPLFDGLEARDPDLIGQGSYWEAEPATDGDQPGSWRVTFTIGWGDCPAGCINRHTWTYEVRRDATVRFVSEDGPELDAGVLAQRLAAGALSGVGGRVLAGPVCPVEQPGVACAPRPVAGATLVVRAADGREAARFTTDASGLYRIVLPVGEYTLEAQPVDGLMGTPGPLPFSVADGVLAPLDVPYDTGIR